MLYIEKKASRQNAKLTNRRSAATFTQKAVDESSGNLFDAGELAAAPQAHLLVGGHGQNCRALKLPVGIQGTSVFEFLTERKMV
jgi:hypothetical protein